MKPLAALLVFGCAAPAFANNIGIFGKSGRDAEQGTCTQCHIGENGPTPTITVTGFDGPFSAGGFADFTITVITNDPSGGLAGAACPDRCAGFNAAVDVGSGTFVVPDGSAVQTNATRDEISHIAKSPFVGGSVAYHVALAGLTEGAHTLYIAANDVNGQDAVGDRVGVTTVPFTVGAATSTPPPDATKPGGCAAVGGGPLAAPAGLALALLARRRRSRA